MLWAASVSVVSRAGITEPLRRAAVILVLVPGSLAELVAVPSLVVGGLVFVSSEQSWMFQDTWVGSASSRALVVLLLAVVVTLMAFVLRWLSFWVLADGRTPATALEA